MSIGEERFKTCKYRYDFLYLASGGRWRISPRCNPPGSAGHASPRLCEKCPHYVKSKTPIIPMRVARVHIDVFLKRDKEIRHIIKKAESLLEETNKLLSKTKELLEELRRLKELEESVKVDEVVEVEESAE